MRAGLEVRLLGPVSVRGGGGAEVDDERALRGHAAHLLAWMALHPERAWSADELARRLWPGGPPPTARTAIQGHVSRLRRMLGGSAAVRIDTVPGGYALRSYGGGHRPESAGPTDSPIDAHRFRALCERAANEHAAGDPRHAIAHLTDALSLWRGRPLAGLPDEPVLHAEADVLDDQRLGAEEALADALIAAGEIDRALSLLGQLVNDEPLREHRWALLMIALTRAGRQTDALRAYRRAAAVLVERTGLDPGHELRRLETAILLQDPSLDAARWQPALGSVPAPFARVVGRDADRAAVVARLAEARLVTIVGPGGVGKTTLALDVGAAAAAMYADGAVLVDLGAGGPDDVDAILAAAVGAPPPGEGTPGDEPLARAVGVLAQHEVLVILDDCQHVRAEAARAVAELLRGGPRLRALATSQAPLGVAGEAVVVLDPLDAPAEGADPATVRRSAAAELFARRLHEMGCPVADDDDWRHVGAIARALDGLPLAIEIAAGAARTEPLAALARRLSADSSPLLDAEPPVGPGRRRLGASLDAAVARLDSQAGRLYAHLSVFPGSFAVPAAAAVAGIDKAVAGAALTRLAAASLVALDSPDRSRYRLLRPVRAHAAGRLDPADAQAARDRLVAWCAALAADLDCRLHSAEQAAVVSQFTAELPTVRMVLRRLLDEGDIARAAWVFEHLAVTWANSPASPEVGVWADEMLGVADRLPDGPRARLEVVIVHCQYAFELIAAKLDLAEAALRRAEAAGDPFATAAAQVQVAIGLGWRNSDVDRAVALVDQARAGMVGLGEPYWAAVMLEVRGLLAIRRLEAAAGIAILDEAAAEYREHGGPGDVGHVLTFIGYARRAVGDLTGARRAFDEARFVLGSVQVRTWLRATVGAAHAALALGDLDGAGEVFRAAHDRAVEIGDQRIVGTALVGSATIARAEGATDRCVALLSAAAERALSGGDPTDAVTAAGMLAEMLVTVGADDEAAVVLGATELVDDEVTVRIDFGLARDLGPVRAAVGERLGPDRASDLGRDGRVIGLAAAVRRAVRRLMSGGITGIESVDANLATSSPTRRR